MKTASESETMKLHTPKRLAGRLTACLLLISCLACAAVTATARSKGPDAPADTDQALFVKGQNLYNQNLYHQAIAVFRDFVKSYPQSEIKDLALLWLGRCYIRVGDVGSAEQIAARLRETPDTQFVGLYEEELRVARQNYTRTATLTPAVAAPVMKSTVELPAAALPEAMASTTSRVIPAADSSMAKPAIDHAATANTVVWSGVDQSLPPNQQPARSDQVQAKQITIVKPPLALSQSPASGAGLQRSASITAPAPAVRLRLEQGPRESTVNGVTFYRLVVVNEGTGIVKDLIVTELLSNDLQFASSDPAPSTQEAVGRSQRLTFRISELRGGASRTLRIAVRPHLGTNADVVLKTKHSVSYQDVDRKTYVTNQQ